MLLDSEKFFYGLKWEEIIEDKYFLSFEPFRD